MILYVNAVTPLLIFKIPLLYLDLLLQVQVLLQRLQQVSGQGLIYAESLENLADKGINIREKKMLALDKILFQVLMLLLLFRFLLGAFQEAESLDNAVV